MENNWSFCKSKYKYIFYLNDIVNFHGTDGKWRSAHQFWECSISISVAVWTFMVFYLDALPGSTPICLFAMVNMPQCYGGMRGWVSFAGWAAEVVISNRQLNKVLISMTSYWLPNGEKKECTDSKLVWRCQPWGCALRRNAYFPLISLLSLSLMWRVWYNVGEPLSLGLDEMGTDGVSSTLESVCWIQVSTIICYIVLYWSQITFCL